MKLNVLPHYVLYALFFGAMSGIAQADPSAQNKEQTNKQDDALSEEFLMFLAEMEEVEGEWVHPVDLSTENPDMQQVVSGTVNEHTEIKTDQPMISEGIDNEKK